MLDFFKLLVICLIGSLCLMLSSEVADRTVEIETFTVMWIALVVLLITLLMLYV